jgi:hypothetical protein
MVRQPGARQFLDIFNHIGMAALLRWLKGVKLPGYKDGGYVAPRASPTADKFRPAVFNIPGVGKVPAKVTRIVAENLARALKIEALMRAGR